MRPLPQVSGATGGTPRVDHPGRQPRHPLRDGGAWGVEVHAPAPLRPPTSATSLQVEFTDTPRTLCPPHRRSAMLLPEEEAWGVQTAGPLARFSAKGAPYLQVRTR